MTQSGKNTALVAPVLNLGGSAGLILFALQLLTGAQIETALIRGFSAAVAVSLVVVVVRSAMLYAQAAATRASTAKAVDPRGDDAKQSRDKSAGNDQPGEMRRAA